MGIGTVLEPLVVVTLLFGGAWINRASNKPFSERQPRPDFLAKNVYSDKAGEFRDEEVIQPVSLKGRSLSPSLLPSQENKWRTREIRLMGLRRTVYSPNTAIFRNRFLSRVLKRFPFLMENLYWAEIYWVSEIINHFKKQLRLIVTGLSTWSCLLRSDHCRRYCQCGS